MPLNRMFDCGLQCSGICKLSGGGWLFPCKIDFGDSLNRQAYSVFSLEIGTRSGMRLLRARPLRQMSSASPSFGYGSSRPTLVG